MAYYYIDRDAIAMPPPNPLPIGGSTCGSDSPPTMSSSEPESPEVNIIIPQLSVQVSSADAITVMTSWYGAGRTLIT